MTLVNQARIECPGDIQSIFTRCCCSRARLRFNLVMGGWLLVTRLRRRAVHSRLGALFYAIQLTSNHNLFPDIYIGCSRRLATATRSVGRLYALVRPKTKPLPLPRANKRWAARCAKKKSVEKVKWWWLVNLLLWRTVGLGQEIDCVSGSSVCEPRPITDSYNNARINTVAWLAAEHLCRDGKVSIVRKNYTFR